MMRRVLAILLAAGLLASAGCTEAMTQGADVAVEAAAAVPADGDAAAVPDVALADAVNDFGFELFRELPSDNNTVISPLSVHVALAMCANGAAGKTLAEMADVLGVDQQMAAANSGYANLLASLAAPGSEATVTVANSLWANTGTAFEEPFLDANRTSFGAEVRTMDMGSPDAPAAINGWIEEHTNGKITDMISELPPATLLALVNAVHFIGAWEEPFEESVTEDRPFTLASGEKVDVPMMRNGGSWAYAENASMQIARLPYAGSRYAAYVMVPRGETTPADLVAEMDAAGWRELVAMTESREGQVLLPRFETEWGSSLIDQLAAMGMPSAFGDADFSAMTPEEVAIGAVDHKTYLHVDEKGTEAAAATVIAMAASAAPGGETPPFELRADRPFILTLVDEASGTLLFLAVIDDPR